jgi:hypothetical protein
MNEPTNTDPDALSFPDCDALDCVVDPSDLGDVEQNMQAPSSPSYIEGNEEDRSSTSYHDPAQFVERIPSTAHASEPEPSTAHASEPNKRGPQVKGVPFQGVTRNTSKVHLCVHFIKSQHIANVLFLPSTHKEGELGNEVEPGTLPWGMAAVDHRNLRVDCRHVHDDGWRVYERTACVAVG